MMNLMMNLMMNYTNTWWYVSEIFVAVGFLMYEIAVAKKAIDW